MKKPLIIIAVVVVLLLIVIVALPFLIDVNQFKPKLQSDLGTALGRKVEVGNIKLAIFSGGVAIDDLAISDDPAFSRELFLKAKQLTVGVNLIPLIFSKKLEVRSFGVWIRKCHCGEIPRESGIIRAWAATLQWLNPRVPIRAAPI